MPYLHESAPILAVLALDECGIGKDLGSQAPERLYPVWKVRGGSAVTSAGTSLTTPFAVLRGNIGSPILRLRLAVTNHYLARE